MTAAMVDGGAIAAGIREEVARDAAELAARGVVPGLVVILVGEDRASATYVRSKRRACKQTGIRSDLHQLPETVSQAELLDLVGELNRRDDVDGILVQLPLPGHIDSRLVIEAVDPAKDVDGFHPLSVGRLVSGAEAFVPATPMGIMRILEEYKVPIKGARAVVIGRSAIVGKPVSMLLLRAHATVTICHSRTRDLAAVAREADVLIAAAGRAALVTPDFVKPGAAVIDVGTNAVDDAAVVADLFGAGSERLADLDKKGYTLVGDVHPGVAEKAALLTPVPGGVGPLTIAMLLVNCIKAARLRRG